MSRTTYGLEFSNGAWVLRDTVTAKEQVTDTSTAQSYAASISIMNSMVNAAPELVLEEDERVEDGDDDDDDVDADLDLCCVWKKTRITPWLWPFHRSLQSTRNRMRTRAEAEN